MDKDLIVIIQSRSRPQHLAASLEVLFLSCSSKDNFDIYCLIDDDQIDLYSFLKEEFPEAKWKIVPHVEKSWFPLLKAQQELIENNNYYFNWVITDDTVIHGINEEWDSNIINKKHVFKDDLFTMYTQSFFAGRDPIVFEKGYCVSSDENINAKVVLNCNEMLPICTKKWVEMMWDIFKEGNYSSSRELITASLIYKLIKKYNINRHVSSLTVYGGASAGEDEIGSSNSIINNNGLSRDEAYVSLVRNNYNDIMPVVDQMYEYIKNYK